VYSLNVPVPSGLARLASDLAGQVPGAQARARGEHTLLVKRLGAGEAGGVAPLVERARTAVAGAEPFPVDVTGVDYFAEPETGTGPVVYLAVESPPLVALHRRLCDAFEPVAHLEGEAYVPHITIARGGERAAAERLAARDIEPRRFEVTELVVWDAERGLATTRLSLPV
jgi:2'-5' RNA ligase